MKIYALVAAMSAASLLIVPVAAQAGTSAASMSAPVSYGGHSTASVAKKGKAKGGALAIGALATGAAGVGIYFGVRKNKDRSPGAQS